MPLHLYRTYGDRELLEHYFPLMSRGVDYVAEKNADGMWIRSVGNNGGDWLTVGANTPKPVVSLAYRIRSVDIVACAARALGDARLGQQNDELARSLRRRFEESYVAPGGEVLGDTQTGYLLALASRLVDDSRRVVLAEKVVANILNNECLLSKTCSARP